MKGNRTVILIIIFGLIILIPFIGRVPLFDWDEINFAEAAREMLVSQNFTQVTINFQPFYEKPPLFFWIQAACMQVFGINEFAARLPDVLFAILSLVVLYNIGKRLKDHNFGLIWVMCFGASLLPFTYSQSGIIDPVFNFFIFIGIYFGFRSLIEQGSKKLLFAFYAGTGIGLSVLTKGPVGIILSYLTFFFFMMINFRNIRLNIWAVFILFFSTFLIPCIWFGIETISNGSAFIREFIVYQIRLFTTEDAGHGGPFYYHFFIILFGMFPASVFALGVFRREKNATQQFKLFKNILAILFFLILIIFSVVKTKIVHYSSLAYYPVSFMAAIVIYELFFNPGKRYSKWYSTGIAIIGVFIGLAMSSVVLMLGMFRHILSPLLNDQFARENLNAKVHWSVLDISIGFLLIILLFIALALIHKKNYRIKGIVMIFASIILISKSAFITIVPKVEQYSQHAAIEFYKSKQQENCYVEVLGFKSYAHYFYTLKQPLTNTIFYNKDSLLYGTIDKRTYFVAKVPGAKDFIKKYELELLYSKNGFVFMKREPK
jgi:hypothetical protein